MAELYKRRPQFGAHQGQTLTERMRTVTLRCSPRLRSHPQGHKSSQVNGLNQMPKAVFGQHLGDVSQALQAANLVGHTVLAQSDTGYFDGTAPLGGVLELGAAAGSVQIDITDASGQLVRRIDLGQQPPGTVRFDWDGRNSDGDIMDAGQYQISSRVVRGANIESVPTFIRANVESVTLGRFGGGMTLNLTGGGSLSLSQVYQII